MVNVAGRTAKNHVLYGSEAQVSDLDCKSAADNAETARRARELRNTLIFAEPEKIATAIGIIEQNSVEISKIFGELSPLVQSTGGKALLAEALIARENFVQAQTQMISLVKAEKFAAA